MRITLFFGFLFFANLGLIAQHSATISGRIMEESIALPYATITLTSTDAETMLTGTLSEEDGRFFMEGIPKGDYILSCSFVGFETKEVAVLIGEKNLNYDLGKIVLLSKANELEEVIVQAKKAIVGGSLDKKSFSLADQTAQSGGSILDAMKALPGVTVDQEGNVLLRGSDKVSVLVDGKQSGMTGFGNQQGLGNIPAANIERIEIINNPSAKYDAIGMAGIINIIYKKEQATGFNGTIGMTLGLGELTTRKADLPTELGRYNVNPKLNPNFSLNYRTGKTNAFLQGSVLQQRKLPNNEFTTRNYTDGVSTISAVPENRTQTHYIVQGGIDYQLSEKDQLSFVTIFDFESHVDTSQIPFIDLLTNQRYRYWHWKEEEVTGYLNFSLNYEHQFPEKGHELKIGAQYVRGWEDESYFLNDSSAIRVGQDATNILAIENTTSITTDYVKPLRFGRVELGAKVQIRRLPVTYEITRGQQSIIYEGIGDWSDWGENIYAGYLNYVLEKKKMDIEGGLRIEQTNVFYDIDPQNIYYPNNDAYDYFKVYPNIRWTFKLNPINQLSLFYNQRVDRPGEPNLRIFPKYDDPELLKVGDPYVRPQFTQTYEVAYKRIWETGSLFIATYYRAIDSPFLRIFNTDDSNLDYAIINKIYQNVGSGSNQGFEILLAQSLKEYWKVSTSFNWYNNKIDAFTGELLFPFKRSFSIPTTEDQTWDIKINNQIDLPNKTQIQLTAIYLAPKNIPQGRQLSRSSIDIGIQKSILAGKGELILSVTDLLNDFGIRQEIETADFTALYENYYETQVVRLGFKYKW